MFVVLKNEEVSFFRADALIISLLSLFYVPVTNFILPLAKCFNIFTDFLQPSF
jgi:hypothetical protein